MLSYAMHGAAGQSGIRISWQKELCTTPMWEVKCYSIAFTIELSEAGITGSIASVDEALDGALMESTLALYMSELINGLAGTGATRGGVEIARSKTTGQRKASTLFDRLPSACTVR